MNETFKVASKFDCDIFAKAFEYSADPIWSQTLLGCKVLEILQEIYKFNITYVTPWLTSESDDEGRTLLPYFPDRPELYARQMALDLDILNHAYPIQAVVNRRFGFTYRRAAKAVVRAYFSEPLTRPVWNCLYAMALLVTVIFYLLNRCEKRLIGRGGECCFFYELLVMIGAYCQHILPVQPILLSRRTAYFIFFMFAYIIYCFYTSKLLSHLVNDKDKDMSLEELLQSNYELFILEDMKLTTGRILPCLNMNKVLMKKLMYLKYVNMSSAVEALMNNSGAILTDYMSLRSAVTQTFDSSALCDLITIDVFSNVTQYFFTSKFFPYKEQFKISTLRARETGILQRLTLDETSRPQHCTFQLIPCVHLAHVIYPVIILAVAYILSALILMGEKMHYRRNRLPYVN